MCLLGPVDPRDQREQREQRVQREETWNTVPVTKNSRTIDPTKIPKISKVRRAGAFSVRAKPALQWGTALIPDSYMHPLFISSCTLGIETRLEQISGTTPFH